MKEKKEIVCVCVVSWFLISVSDGQRGRDIILGKEVQCV